MTMTMVMVMKMVICFHTRAKCEIRMIILVTDDANDGILVCVYAI